MSDELTCQICGNMYHPKGYGSHLQSKHNISGKEYYDRYFKKDDEGICIECGKPTTYQTISLGYAIFCGDGCSNKNIKVKQKIQDTFIERFGDNPNRIESIKLKKQKTFHSHYGVKNCSQHKSIKEKKRKSYQKRYGVDHYSQSSEGRRIHRLNSIKLVENQKLNGDVLSPKVGYGEKPFFDELQKWVSYKILRNDSTFRYGIARYPDGHIPELKIFIQFDERFHFKDRECKIYQDDDIRCTLELASLGYLVFRVSEKNWKDNSEVIIQQFKEIIACQNELR